MTIYYPAKLQNLAGGVAVHKGSCYIGGMAAKHHTVKRGRPCIYPWDVWLRRGTTALVKGVDFHCECSSFAILAYRQINRRKMQDRTKVSVRDLRVTIQVK